MMRTLLTGFGPFGRIVNNPSQRIVEHFARAGAPGHELTTRVLPVAFEGAEREIRSLLRGGLFDAAVLLGVAQRSPEVRLEQFGRRREPVGRTDADGAATFQAVLRPGALDLYPATVPLEPLLEDLAAAGLPARLSEDAGAYVCNHTYYAALQALAEAERLTRCLFLHVPADPGTLAESAEGPTMFLEQQIEAVGRVLARLAAPEGAPPAQPA